MWSGVINHSCVCESKYITQKTSSWRSVFNRTAKTSIIMQNAERHTDLLASAILKNKSAKRWGRTTLVHPWVLFPYNWVFHVYLFKQQTPWPWVSCHHTVQEVYQFTKFWSESFIQIRYTQTQAAVAVNLGHENSRLKSLPCLYVLVSLSKICCPLILATLVFLTCEGSNTEHDFYHFIETYNPDKTQHVAYLKVKYLVKLVG